MKKGTEKQAELSLLKMKKPSGFILFKGKY